MERQDLNLITENISGVQLPTQEHARGKKRGLSLLWEGTMSEVGVTQVSNVRDRLSLASAHCVSKTLTTALLS